MLLSNIAAINWITMNYYKRWLKWFALSFSLEPKELSLLFPRNSYMPFEMVDN